MTVRMLNFFLLYCVLNSHVFLGMYHISFPSVDFSYKTMGLIPADQLQSTLIGFLETFV
uniref:Uncharacterized protein n=1 Tax=Rhizophora mucronata TaxID=61149 RepID=A0A2P2N651_RHIMU